MSEPKFFSRDSLFAPKHVEHEVAGHVLRFFPISTRVLWKMRRVVAPIVEALRVLSGGKNDFERTVDQGLDEETGEQRFVTHLGAIKPELAKLREESTSAAWKGAVDALFADESRDFLGEMIADSLREEFTREQAKDRAVVDQLMERLDLQTLVDMVQGLLKANARVFGPFGEKMREVARKKFEDVLDGQAQTSSESPSESPNSEDDEPSETELQPRSEAEAPVSG